MTLHATVAGWLLGPPSGANRRLLALLAAIGPRLRHGERVTVLHRADFHPPPLPGITWQVAPLPAGPTFARVAAERRHLARLLRTLAATVHDHGFLPLPRLPVPTTLLVHDARDADGQGRWPPWLARWLLRRSTARAHAVVVPSDFTAGRLRHHGVAARVEVVRNGVELPPAPPPPRGPHLLHLGHLEPRKHLAVVLRALAQLPVAARPPLVLAGRDSGASTGLRRLAADLGIAEAVRWLGVVDEPTAQQLLATARAVVMPSRYEGFGLPALEGLAHGRPVLVAAAGALPEVVGNAGICLPPDDPAAWAAAIAATASEPATAAAERRRYAAQFGWQLPAEQLLGLWRELSG